MPSLDPETPELLKTIFLQHESTAEIWRKTYPATRIRKLWYGLEWNEELEEVIYENGSLVMSVKQIISAVTDDCHEILSLTIVDNDHGVSSPRDITEVAELRHVLKAIDDNRYRSPRIPERPITPPSETPDWGGTLISTDQ